MWCRLAIIPDLAGRINQCADLVDELQLAAVPAPGVAGRDVGAADPAVDTEELDAIVLAPRACVLRSVSAAAGGARSAGCRRAEAAEEVACRRRFR